MTFLDRWAVAWLTAHGFRIFAPGVDLPVPPITLADMKTALEGQRYTVLAPKLPPADGEWLPLNPQHPSRIVVGVMGNRVHYTCRDVTHECSVHSFDGWRRKFHAKRAGTAP